MPATGKFVVKHQPGKGYHLNLVAASGQVIASREPYETHRACLEGIESAHHSGGARPSRTIPPR